MLVINILGLILEEKERMQRKTMNYPSVPTDFSSGYSEKIIAEISKKLVLKFPCRKCI